MTLCILPQPSAESGTILRLEGWLTAETVSELQRACAEATKPVCLNLAHLINADTHGIEALRGLLTSGVRFDSPSHYLALLLGMTDEEH
jgi:ABC-type transporter Mla MlaB component